MSLSKVLGGAAVATVLCCFGSLEADAIEIVGGARPSSGLSEGMVSQVYVARRGGAVYHGGAYRGPHGGVYRGGTVYRGGAYRGGAYRGGAYGYRGGAYGYHGGAYGYRAGYVGGWARPGWYGWPAGGAIAAGAAIGVISAAAAASWAGAPPGPGLCWYYTNPSQQQGFWDACQ
jgi:hypothetical protein